MHRVWVARQRLAEHSTRSTVATVAIAHELAGVLWAAAGRPLALEIGC